MKKFLYILFAFVLLIAMTGCTNSSSSKMIGHWEGEYTTNPSGYIMDLNLMGYSSSMDFNNDGSFKFNITNKGDFGSNGISGTWSISNNTVTLELYGSTLSGTVDGNNLTVDFTPLVTELGTMTYVKQGE